MFTTEMLEKSIVVSAHPDDEVLWFSSIIDRVDAVLLCYLSCKSRPLWNIGRKKTLSEYPIKNIACLGIDESEVFNHANWHNPVITTFGINISTKSISAGNYRENYYKLKKGLKNKLIGYRNVFTHNPWGEYGNEEHIQIYRVVKDLQEEMKFNLWFSNYCSNKSFNLMLKYIHGFDSGYVTLKTNKKLGNYIKELYKKNGCWTWYDDWEYFNEESFMKDKSFAETIKMYSHIFPLNMIKVKLPSESKRKFKFFRVLSAKISRNQKRNDS